MKKKKILTLSDHPLSPSGVGTQTKYMIEALLKTGNYQFVCLGGAVKHADYTPVKVSPFQDDWIIYPVDGYGNAEMIRSILQKEKPEVKPEETEIAKMERQLKEAKAKAEKELMFYGL